MALTILIEEAKAADKWCPFARVLGTLIGRDNASEPDRIVASGVQNRGYQMGLGLHNCACLGRRCAAWRWARTHVVDAGGDMKPSDNTHGFCGLAGDPR